MDELLSAWRERLLGIYRYVILDAQYEKVRQAGQVLDAAVLVACGVGADGQRDILGSAVSLSETEVHWRVFLKSLKDRGLCGIELIFSDAHEGLQTARRAVFPSVPWQRRQFHSQQNAGQCVTSVSLRAPVATEIRAIFTTPDRHEAQRFTVFGLPASHRRRLRTTNLVERMDEEIRRRTRVARLFPNEASCLRPVSAVPMEIAEDWQTADRRHVTFGERGAVEG